MLNTFFNAAAWKTSDLVPFQGPNFSFLSFSVAHRHIHTESHSYQTVSDNAHPCRSEEPTTAQMTQSQATQFPLFLYLEQKKSLTITLPWIVTYLGMLYRWSILKRIHITESNRAFEGSWDWSQRENVVECVLQQIAMEKSLLLKPF